MRGHCQSILHRFYGDALGIHDTEIESQGGHEGNIAYNVGRLIGKPSLFHYGPEDAQVSYLPLLHQLCLNY
jgi:hypothetical protein